MQNIKRVFKEEQPVLRFTRHQQKMIPFLLRKLVTVSAFSVWPLFTLSLIDWQKVDHTPL